MMRKFVILASLLLVPACSVLPKGEAAPELYRLSPMKDAASPRLVAISGAPLPWQVVVQPPLASLSLDTNRIAVLTSPHEVKYLQGVRWNDNTPLIVQDALLDALEATGRFAAVGRPESGLHTDYALVCELRDFSADLYSSGRPVTHIRMTLQLVKQPVGNIAASRSFEMETPAEGRSAMAIVKAFDQGLHGLLPDVTDWVAASLPTGKTQMVNHVSRSIPERNASSTPGEAPSATP